MIRQILVLCLLLITFPLAANSQTVLKVIDGDTFKALWEGDTVSVRLCGVDTPESRKNAKAKKDARRSSQDLDAIIEMGKLSSSALRTLLPKGSNVRFELDVRTHDRYGRVLAYVYLQDGRMVNELLLKEGMATTMTIAPNVKYAERFREVERTARSQQKGHWKAAKSISELN